jgi:hypothetical protein
MAKSHGACHLEAHLELVKRVHFQIQRDDSTMMHDDGDDDDIVVIVSSQQPAFLLQTYTSVS